MLQRPPLNIVYVIAGGGNPRGSLPFWRSHTSLRTCLQLPTSSQGPLKGLLKTSKSWRFEKEKLTFPNWGEQRNLCLKTLFPSSAGAKSTFLLNRFSKVQKAALAFGDGLPPTPTAVKGSPAGLRQPCGPRIPQAEEVQLPGPQGPGRAHAPRCPPEGALAPALWVPRARSQPRKASRFQEVIGTTPGEQRRWLLRVVVIWLQ